ncbi:hypothetical protein EV359DRAFT_66563 [Lentinula novae-zelandiae]|nr:hypothetical protein EV359DRAFT_66563 [Lentinula novae-zelandiae]
MTEVFFALLLLLSLRLVQNLPINATSVNDCGNDNLQAKDYNYRKTLTTILATANCTVAGSVKAVKAAAKLFIPINMVEVREQLTFKVKISTSGDLYKVNPHHLRTLDLSKSEETLMDASD